MKKRYAFFGVVVALVLATVAVQAQEDSGIQSGPFTLSPFAGVDGTYDSNISRASSNEESDFYFQSSLGLNIGLQDERFKANLLGFGANRSYIDHTDLNFSSVGETLNLAFGTSDSLTVDFLQSYRVVEDRDSYGPSSDFGGMAPDAFLDADVRSRREVVEAGSAVNAALSDKIDARAAYRFNRTDFDNENLFDLTGNGAQAAVAYRVTDRSAATVTLIGGLQDSDEVDGEAQYSAARFGGRTRGTERLVLNAGVGVQHLNRPEGGETEQGFHYDANAAWVATDKTVILVESRNGLQLSSVFRANAVDYSVFRFGVSYRMRPSITLSANTVFRIDDYSDPVQNADGQLVNRKDEGASIYLRADCRMPLKPIRLFAQVNHEEMDSTARDYKVSGASLGMNIEY